MREADKRLDRLFRLAAEDSAEKTHLLLGDGTAVSYAQTYERAGLLAGVLAAAGVSRGDRVAAVLSNSRELVEFYIACGLCGAIGVALNTLSTQREAQRIFTDCTPSAVIAASKFVNRLPDEIMPANMRLKVVVGEAPGQGWSTYDTALAAAQRHTPALDLSPDDPAIMIYSSGTTGLPKGILLSHQGIIDNALRTIEAIDYRADDRFLTLLPMFSSFGFAFDLLHAALNRAATVILDKFDEYRALDFVERFRVTFLAGVPTMFARMFDSAVLEKKDISSLRLIDVGGGPVSLRLKRMLKEELGISVVESYGLTEISPVASVQRSADVVGSSSCGQPLPTFEVRVVDAEGHDLPSEEPGELLFRSNTLMVGYWKQPEQTAQAVRDGWLHSGDVGRIDGNGEIHILDRTKDMIVSNGFNVYPKEVENAIAELDTVQAVAVVGRPDEIRGEVIHAFIVPKQGKTLVEQEVLDYCTKNLARFKVPRSVSLLDELPLTGSGKIQRFRLREMLEEASAVRETT